MSNNPTLREWAAERAPWLDVVAASTPEPVLEPGDLLAVVAEPDTARDLLLTWERLEPADAAVGVVALGTAPDRQTNADSERGPDPEGVVGHTAGRVARGAVPGALVGAAAVGSTVGLASGSTGAALGAALGGAAFGAVAGATAMVAKGTGWGDAYQHAFVDPEATTLVVASFHSADRDHVHAAERAARERGSVQLATVRADGSVRAVTA